MLFYMYNSCILNIKKIMYTHKLLIIFDCFSTESTVSSKSKDWFIQNLNKNVSIYYIVLDYVWFFFKSTILC